jgi:hypothetical protein
MKFGFIAKHRSIWPVVWLCEALGVSRSGFQAWLAWAERPDDRRRGAGDEGAGELHCQRPPTAPEGSGGTCSPTAHSAACTRSSG